MKTIKLKNGESIEIRPAVKEDGKALLKYVESISEESDNLTFGPGEFKATAEQEESFLEHMAGQENAIYLIALNGNKIVGSLNFSGGSRPRIAHTGEFGISVLKEFWGYGLGTELLEYLLRWCRNGKVIRKINLRVRTDNYNAIHVYKKLGFAVEGTITRELFINGCFYDMLAMGLCID